VAALSPSGDRIAVRDGVSRFVAVWSKDGRRVATVNTPVGPRGETRTSWVAFAGEQHLWILSGKRLALVEVATGKAVATLPGEATSAPTCTPGRKWLLVCTAEELIILNAADGKRVSAISLPAALGAQRYVAVHPSGRVVAVSLANKADVLLGVWDLATGQLTD